jgi:hypothetical protein
VVWLGQLEARELWELLDQQETAVHQAQLVILALVVLRVLQVKLDLRGQQDSLDQQEQLVVLEQQV